MVDVTHVLSEKYKGMEWSLNGSPTTEAEFNTGFTIHKANGVAAPTWANLETQLVEMQTEYDAKQYQRDRKPEYKSWEEQLDMMYWDMINGTTKWRDLISSIKKKYPKLHCNNNETR